MTENVTYGSIVDDPKWRLCALQPMKSELIFHYLDQAEIERENYIDQGYLNQQPGRYVSIPMEALIELTENKPLPPTHYIFHTAFCGSTLLSRCMNHDSKSFSVREPNALMQLAQFKREQGDQVYQMDIWPKLVRLVVYLLGRPFVSGAAVIIKPSNSMNNLIVDLLSLDVRSKALIMSSEVNQFVVSNLKKQGYEQFCQQMFSMLSKDNLAITFNKEANLEQISGAKMASLVWALQQVQINRSANQLDQERLRYLQISEFLNNPKSTIESLSDFFSLNFSALEIDDILSSQAFTSHSKEGRDNFNSDSKQHEDEQIVAQHKSEIEDAQHWLTSLALDLGEASRHSLIS